MKLVAPGRRILLVERDHATAQLYKLGLVLRGFSVDLAVDGEDGIQQVVRGGRPDAVVLDLSLPRVYRDAPRRDEIQLLAKLRALRLSMPIIVLGGEATDVRELLSLGATGCVPKSRTTPRALAGEMTRWMTSPSWVRGD